MRKITATLKGDGPILREVLHYLVTNAGMEVVGESSDSLDLLCSIDRLRPEVDFLWASDGLKEPGIVSHLLQEFRTSRWLLFHRIILRSRTWDPAHGSLQTFPWNRFTLQLWRVWLTNNRREIGPGAPRTEDVCLTWLVQERVFIGPEIGIVLLGVRVVADVRVRVVSRERASWSAARPRVRHGLPRTHAVSSSSRRGLRCGRRHLER
jgi:hypothetical protein